MKLSKLRRWKSDNGMSSVVMPCHLLLRNKIRLEFDSRHQMPPGTRLYFYFTFLMPGPGLPGALYSIGVFSTEANFSRRAPLLAVNELVVHNKVASVTSHGRHCLTSHD
jgi:hypothetical protein